MPSFVARSLRIVVVASLALAGCAHESPEEAAPEVAPPAIDLAPVAPPVDVAAFDFHVEGERLTAAHPVLDMRIALALDAPGGARIELGAREGDAALGLRLSSIGSDPAPAATITHEDNRVVLDRGNVREWYVHEARGVEQRFTVLARPAGGLDLWMELETDAQAVQIDEDTVELHSASLAIRYAELSVQDADGRELDARLSLEDGRLGIHVDDDGARYPVEIDPLITVEQKLVAADADVNDQFGHDVAIDGDTLIVGAHTDDVAGASNAGSAYVYVRSGGAWTLQQKLSPAVAGEFFGGSVAIEGDTVVIGAPLANAGSFTDGGAVYVYVRSGGFWSQQARLTAAAVGSFDELGRSVAISGDTLLAGAEGAGVGNYATVFVRSGTTWTEQATLTASDAMTGDWFGYAVDLDGDTALVGAFDDDTAAGTSAGSAYVFVRSGTTWTQQAHLFASDALASDELGKAVALSGNVAFVGAPSDDHGSASLAGSTYVFERTGTTWTQRAKLIPSDVAAIDQFGDSMSIDGTMAIVASRDRAYLYQRIGGVWTQDLTLRASDAMAGDAYGSDVAIDNGNAVVGASLDTHGAIDDAGSAYTYRLVPVGDPCTSVADCASGFCVDGVCCDAACSGGTGDCRACSIAAGATRNGFCETLPSTRTCRAASGACDVAEQCDGSTTVCPGDGFTTAGTTCRPAVVGGCDVAETCSGTSGACPSDGFASTGTVCRPTAGVCDVADTCTGSSATCPTNVFAPSGTPCRAPADLCDAAESCTGTSAACPSDGPAAAGTPCRASAGMCDVAETCNGASMACPSDGFVSAGTTCRGAADVCDVAERCTGGSALCPMDAFATAGTGCRAAAGVCDVAESCTGLAPTCPGDVLVGAGVECRASAGVCDVAEACTGIAAACPTNGLVNAGTECRASAGDCDVAEACSGSTAACPTNAFVPSGTECRASAGVCDVAEACTGASAACGPDLFAAAIVCRAATDLCDAPERCAGTASCPADELQPSGAACRLPVGACDVVEVCNGSDGTCPADSAAPDGMACGNGMVCDGDEVCTAGACASATTPECDDGDPCTADLCVEPGGCAQTPIENCCLADSDCDDGSACTTDRCDLVTHVCDATAIDGCCEVDADCDDGDPCTDDACEASACTNVPLASCDAGVPDAGVSDGGARDGSAFADAGSPVATAGGCGCSVPSGDGPSHGAWLVASLLVLGWVRRRAKDR